MRLKDKVSLVTGAASGIGEGIAHALGREGARVAVCDINKELGTAVAAAVPDSIFVELDVTNATSVEHGVDRVTKDLGPIDILVNVAGADVVKPFLDTDEDLWEWLVQLNLMGVFRCTKAVLPGMIERETGRLINIGSDAGRVGSSGEAVYSGCKGGVIAFAKTIARETARYGITSNTVCPGPTDTPSVQKMLAEGGERYLDAMKRAIPLGRLATPADIAAAVVFLACDDASYVTGQTISVSGGLSMA